MLTNNLTHRACLEAKTTPGAKMTRFTDGQGLYLLVMRDGKKFWRFDYRYQGRRKMRGFGTFPEVSLSEARKLRKIARKLLVHKIDPIQYDRNAREEDKQLRYEDAAFDGWTFEQVALRMWESQVGELTEVTQQRRRQQLETYLFPAIGCKPIDEISSRELLKLFREVATQVNHLRKKTWLSRKLCQLTSEVFEYAKTERNDFDRNPCANMLRHLPKHDEQTMQRAAKSRLGDFLVNLNHYTGSPQIKAAIWIMLLTGCRQISVRSARWKDFDLKKKVWHRRPEKQDKKSVDLPLPDPAVAILKCLKKTFAGQPEELVFPAPFNKLLPLSESALCNAIKRLGFARSEVGHGIREVVVAELKAQGFPAHLIAMQVGREPDKVKSVDSKAKLFDQRREMMQFFADYLHKRVKDASGLRASARGSSPLPLVFC